MGALAEAHREPPYAATDPVKDVAAQSVLKAVGAFKEPEIVAVVAALGEAEQKALMKYLYRFWKTGLPPKVNAQLFVWHGALVEACGESIITGAIFDWRWP